MARSEAVERLAREIVNGVLKAGTTLQADLFVIEKLGAKCVWAIDDIGGESMYETQCGHTFEFNDGGPQENGARFCCYCGKSLVEMRRSELSEKAHTNGIA